MQQRPRTVEWHFNLSSGTPAMGWSFLLLGRSRWSDATLHTSSRAGHHEVVTGGDLGDIFARHGVRVSVTSVRRAPEDGAHDPFRQALSWAEGSPFGAAVESARRLARLGNFHVALLGESGTGKEGLARGIHMASERAGGPFVPVNCGAIPDELFEAEMFGAVRGAFTGLTKDRDGHFFRANGGTIFLDEIADLSLGSQVKLLRAVQEKQIRRLGDVRDLDANVRIVCATHKDVPAMVEGGSFRADLYYRLFQLKIRLPPLRERPIDVELLANLWVAHLNASFAAFEGRPLYVTPSGHRYLIEQTWPGNVRQLQQVLLGAAVHPATQGAIGRDELKRALDDDEPRAKPGGDSRQWQPLGRKRLTVETVRIALRETGNQRDAAARLGVTFQAVSAFIKRNPVLKEPGRSGGG